MIPISEVKKMKKIILTLDSRRILLLGLGIAFCISILIVQYGIAHFKKIRGRIPIIYKLASARMQIDRYAKNIIFLEPTGTGRLTPKQVCAVESAVRSNPEWSVHVLFRSPITDTTGLRIIQHFPNLLFSRIKETRMSSGTPFGPMLKFHKIAQNNSEVLKFLTLFNFAGIYLDMDILVIRSLDELAPTWVVRLPKNLFSGAIFSFAADQYGRDLAAVVTSALSSNLIQIDLNDEEPNDLATDVVTDSLKKYCRTSYPPEMYSLESCPGLQIYDSKAFPISWIDMHAALFPGSLFREQNNPFVLNMKPNRNIDELIAQNFPELAEDYCPTTYQEYGYDLFGT